jgi:hypothetical protein
MMSKVDVHRIIVVLQLLFVPNHGASPPAHRGEGASANFTIALLQLGLKYNKEARGALLRGELEDMKEAMNRKYSLSGALQVVVSCVSSRSVVINQEQLFHTHALCWEQDELASIVKHNTKKKHCCLNNNRTMQ